MAGDDVLRRRFRAARRDPELTVLEGFHALKHALRFGAVVEIAVGTDPDELEKLAAALAPDLAGRFAALVETVAPDVLAELVPLAPRTGVVAIARRKRADLGAALADRRDAPVVLLEQPRNMGNRGACVRVAAAADAAALLTIGENDPWHPDALRGAAGLHYALPAVAAVERAPRAERRPLLALDPAGEEIDPAAIPPRAVLAFGTERHGLSAELLAAADGRIALPMRDGVSSLNLATSVAAVLYAVRLAR
ncbi:MAG TPA: TrmH family RNA methyltransferase [Solirubrobacterales bacterium]|nr:TrmH family RNA methyltransferase [Solirubrobacterales bacterium]